LIHFAYFIQNLKNEILLLSTEWFSKYFCNQQHLLLIDRFDKVSKSWKNNLAIPEKFHNFNQCPLVFLIVTSGCDRHTRVDMKTNEVFGFLPFIANEVAHKGNAHPIMQVTMEEDGYKLKHYKETSKGLKSHVIIGEKAFSAAKNFTHITTAYDETFFIFIITPGEQYSSYEKLILPFDETTWICWLSTFAVAFIAIFIINKMPSAVKNIVFGENIQHAAFNIIGAFFGIGQVKLPSGNFPRIILIFFVLYCLVMRTAYQGTF
jgi:hypothetical protein